MNDLIKTLIAAFIIGLTSFTLSIFISVSDLRGEVKTHQMVDFAIRESIAKDIEEIKDTQITILKYIRNGRP